MKMQTISSENLLGLSSGDSPGRNAARNRLINGLLSWNKRWMLNGADVQCRICSAAQEVDGDDIPFKHFDTCAALRGETANHDEQHPWRELAELLRDLPSVSGYTE